jgi:hypothetical protein
MCKLSLLWRRGGWGSWLAPPLASACHADHIHRVVCYTLPSFVYLFDMAAINYCTAAFSSMYRKLTLAKPPPGLDDLPDDLLEKLILYHIPQNDRCAPVDGRISTPQRPRSTLPCLVRLRLLAAFPRCPSSTSASALCATAPNSCAIWT